MTTINLLPWRALKKEAAQKSFMRALGLSLSLMLVVGLSVHYWMAYSVKNLSANNERFYAKIVALKAQLPMRLTS